MIYVMFEIWVWIVVAFAGGVFFGWLFWGRKGLTAEERIQFRVMKSREESKALFQGQYSITPLDQDIDRQLAKKKRRDGPVRAKHL